MMQIHEFNEAFVKPLQSVFGKRHRDDETNRDMMKSYYEELRNFNVPLVEKAVKDLRRSYDRWPTIRQVLTAMYENNPNPPKTGVQFAGNEKDGRENYTPYPPPYIEQVLIPWINNMATRTGDHFNAKDEQDLLNMKASWESINGATETWWERNRRIPTNDERQAAQAFFHQVLKAMCLGVAVKFTAKKVM